MTLWRAAHRLLLLLPLFAAVACATSTPAPPASPIEPRLVSAASHIDLLDDADPQSLLTAIDQSLAWFRTLPPDSEFDYGIRTVRSSEMVRAFTSLSAFLQEGPDPASLREWVANRFEAVEIEGERPGRVLVTGYYEPMIAGSPVRTERATIPVHGPPPDLVTVRLRDFRDALPDEQVSGRVQDGRLVPYFARSEIQEGGALDSLGLEIAWVEDRVDLFFVEVQGSGTVRFPDGQEVRIGYAGANGQPYRAIGRLLIDEGSVPVERMSMQAIRAYLEASPEQTARVLNYNPSYVFFRVLNSAPVGALGVPVTGGRSIATDLRHFPRGALGFLRTTRPTLDPEGRVVAGPPLERFVLNQDTGGAIRGGGRADFFWGRGPEAATLAGLMQQEGRIVILVPRLGEVGPG